MKDWFQPGAIEAGEKIDHDLAGQGYGISRSSRLILEPETVMQKRGQAWRRRLVALTFAQPVAPVEKEEPGEKANSKTSATGSGPAAGWDDDYGRCKQEEEESKGGRNPPGSAAHLR